MIVASDAYSLRPLLTRQVKTAAFVQDDMSHRMVKLAAPWASIKTGGIEDAIKAVTSDASAQHLIVDLSDTKDPLLALDRLATVCRPNTRVVALGDVNDIPFYQLLRDAGVAEYLVKPIVSEALRTALDPVSIDRSSEASPHPIDEEKPEIITVVGARGGVGTTMVAVALASISAEREHRRTVLVDLDLRCGSASLALDVEPGEGLAEALANPDRIDALLVTSATAKLSHNLYLLSSEHSLDTADTIQPDALRRLMDGLRHGFRRIILDASRSDWNVLQHAFEQSDSILIVTDFSLAGTRDTGRLAALAQKVAPNARRLIVANRVGQAKKGDLPQADIEKSLGVKFAVVIPEDNIAVPHALNSGKAVPAAAPSSKATVALRALSNALGGNAPSATPGIFARFFGASEKVQL